MASRPSVPQCRNTSWLVCAPRLSPNSTTRGRGPGRSRRRCEDPQPQQPVLLPGPAHHPEGQRRRAARVLQRHGGDVAEREVLQRGGGDVVDVAGAGGGDEDEQRPVQRAGPLQLGHRQVDPLARGRRVVQPDVHLHRGGAGGRAHDGLDRQVRHAGRSGRERLRADRCEGVQPAVAPHARPGHQAARAAADRRAAPTAGPRRARARRPTSSPRSAASPGARPRRRRSPARRGSPRGRPVARGRAARAAPRPAGGRGGR